MQSDSRQGRRKKPAASHGGHSTRLGHPVAMSPFGDAVLQEARSIQRTWQGAGPTMHWKPWWGSPLAKCHQVAHHIEVVGCDADGQVAFCGRWDVCLAGRIGSVPVGSPIPRVVRQQRWSPVSVPHLQAAAGEGPSAPALDWMIRAAVRIRWWSSTDFKESQ